ncbi:MAG: hypothetical protein Q8880_07765 [Bacteroidota bacterium]|nr:hypothetical protein [Bacteroidota bacterium]
MIIHLTLIGFFRALQVFSLSAIKFIIAPLLAFKYGFNFYQTILITTIGGISGVIFFYYLSEWLVKKYNIFYPRIKAFFYSIKKSKSQKPAHHHLHIPGETFIREVKIFTRRNRMIIRSKNKYGLIGIALLTPVLFSIPIGAFIAYRYFSHKKRTIGYLTLSVIVWSIILSSALLIF